jgi:hypothetical protein
VARGALAPPLELQRLAGCQHEQSHRDHQIIVRWFKVQLRRGTAVHPCATLHHIFIALARDPIPRRTVPERTRGASPAMAGASCTQIPTLTLANGAQMPQLAFGTGTTWFEGDAAADLAVDVVAGAASEESQLHKCVRAALDAGYRHLDCAEMYGTEMKVGQALARWLDETGTSRADVFVTSKIWRNCDDVGKACRSSLERLGLEHLDLYLLHTPVSFMTFVDDDKDVVQQRVWRAMEQLVEDGLVKAIGVSNFSGRQLENLLCVHSRLSMRVLIHRFV